MSGQTPYTKIPYPTGTDRVMDGDDAMQAIAARIEARYPRGTLIYAQWVTALGPIGSGNVISTIAVPDNGAGRRLRITAFSTLTCTVGGGTIISRIQEGGNDIGRADVITPATAGVGTFVYFATIVTPSAGPHTYDLKMSASAGTGTAIGGPDRPGYFMAEDIGPVSLA